MPGKILFFCGGAYISGMEVVTLHLMKGLKENGYEVRCIFCGWNDGKFREKLDEIGVPNYEVKIGWVYIKKPLWTLDTLVNYPRAFAGCKKIIKDFNPDIYQFCNFAMSIMLYRLIGQKAVYNLQESHSSNSKNKWIFRLLNKKIKYFTAVSNHIVSILQQLDIPDKKIELIYNGIPPVTSRVVNKPDLMNKNLIQFAIIGQVVAWKGHLVLLEAIEQLVRRGFTNIKVLVYGNDFTDFATEIKRRIGQKGIAAYFEWKGFVNNQNEVYADCDVVIVPSLSGEPCSLTIIEAMTRGKALIVSNRGGNPELVQDKKSGMIFNATESLELADCMQYLINSASAITDFGESAKKRANLLYNYMNMTDSYIHLYNKL